ncbi:MAG: hypothetical protein JRM80_04460 [Nitrososphaerota archaeon]|nr:hypothetical protein [Nitrososphaerota archaeon]
MSEVRALLRFCPACGKRFHIKVVGRKLIEDRMEQTETKRDLGFIGSPMGYGSYGAAQPVVVEEDVPLTVDVEEFQYTYKCKHCGHVWSEMHDQERRTESSGQPPRK